MIRWLGRLGFVVAVIAGCGQAIPRDPSALPGSDLNLTFDGRGNPPVTLRINGTDVADLPCGQGAQPHFAPGELNVPSLPWHLQLLRERDGAVLLDANVTTMPRWLLVWPDGTADLGLGPVLGPAPPTCGPE